MSIENGSEKSVDPRAILIGIAFVYGGMVAAALWIDGRLYRRRARKKREADRTERP